MVNFTIFAGGYTSFVATYIFSSTSKSLTLVGNSTTGGSPSWIAPHPTNSSIIYATNELTQGGLQSLSVLPNKSLKVAQTVSSGGNGPAFAAPISSGQVVVLNYGSGDGRIIPTETDPLQFDSSNSSSPTITFPPPAATVSHPHMAVEVGNELLIPDLGGDKIWRLGQTGGPGVWSIHGQIDQPAGSGPRHLAVRDNFIYTVHETASTLTLQNIPSFPNGTVPLLANVSTIPATFPSGSVFAAAEVLVPETTAQFPNPYIYVSNRNIGNLDPKGDTIAIFQHISKPATPKTPAIETLQLVTQVYTGLDQIRGMMIGRAEDGGIQYLVASGFAGTGGVVVYERTQGGANLSEVARNKDIATRTSFVWA